MDFPVWLRQIAAFTKRDFYRWTTYKTAATTQLITILIGIMSWGINATYRNRPVPEYNCDYISFLIVGLCIGNIIMPLVQGVERRLNPWTLETILMTNIKIHVFVLGNVSWRYIFSLITFIPQILIGIYYFNAKLNVNIISTIIAFAISAAILIGLAMISTGMRIVTKSEDPITWTINTLQQLLAGISFPVEFLENFIPGISILSWLLPQTWVYHLCRLAMLTNASILNIETAVNFLYGLIFAAIIFPTGYYTIKWGINRAKKDGTLGWY